MLKVSSLRVNRRASLAGVAAAALLALGAQAGAASFNYVPDQGAGANYTVAPGGLLQIPIYLEADDTGTALLASEGGLFAAAFDASQLVAGSSTVLNVAGNNTQGFFNSDFGDYINPKGFEHVGVATVTGGVASVSEDEENSAADNEFSDGVGALATATAAGFNGVRLGTLDITGGDAGTVTTFQVGPDPSGTYTNVSSYDLDENTRNELIYDSAAANTFTVTVTGGTVPEPASVASLAIAGGVALMRRRAAR